MDASIFVAKLCGGHSHPPHPEFFLIGVKYFALMTNKWETWDNAQERCARMEAHLATISGEEELLSLRGILGMPMSGVKSADS